MRLPICYTATEMRHYPTDEEYAPGHWRPARPCQSEIFGLRRRFVMAWRVFIGQCDVLSWDYPNKNTPEARL
jgi:hypothetical protein